MQYLGHPVTNNRQNPLVEETTKDFTYNMNGFSSFFDKVNCDVTSVLFKLYCTSFYCAQVCALCDGVIEICNIVHSTESVATPPSETISLPVRDITNARSL